MTRSPSVANLVLFKLYRTIPFVFELRTLLDWMCVKVSDLRFRLRDRQVLVCWPFFSFIFIFVCL